MLLNHLWPCLQSVRLQESLHMVPLRISTVHASLSTNLDEDEGEEDEVSVSMLTASVIL